MQFFLYNIIDILSHCGTNKVFKCPALAMDCMTFYDLYCNANDTSYPETVK